MRALDRCLNIDDLASLARRRLPKPVFDYVEGGADDEVSLEQNLTAFQRYQIVPQALRDVSTVSTETAIMGCRIPFPFFVSATGFSAMMHPGDGELAGARAAAKTGTLYTASTFSNRSLEDIAQASEADKLFQVYVLKDQALSEELLHRVRQAGYKGLCLTVDTVVGGNRERDARSGLSIPPRLTAKSIVQYMMRPKWLLDYINSPHSMALGNFPNLPKVSVKNSEAFTTAMGQLFKKELTWADAERMVQKWDGHFALKGIMSAADAVKAKKIGATAVILSNHGGRQLDSTPAPIDLVEEVREAVGTDMEIIVDGGIRRGTDIFKALALGANACSLGRAYVRGLSAGGEVGALRSLNILESEFKRCMTLAGCDSIDAIGSEHIRRIQ